MLLRGHLNVAFWHKPDLRLAASEGPLTSALPTLAAECRLITPPLAMGPLPGTHILIDTHSLPRDGAGLPSGSFDPDLSRLYPSGAPSPLPGGHHPARRLGRP